MEIVKQLILNFALLLIIFFIFQTKQHSYTDPPNFKMFLYFGFSIFISQLLALTVDSEIRYDLRGIPMIIGGLYLGYNYTLLLFIVTIVIRCFFGITVGFWISFIVYSAQTVLVILLIRKFKKTYPNKKMMIGFAISIISSVNFMIILLLVSHSLSLIEWISYIGISAIGTSIIISSIENWRRSLFLQKKLIQSEKMEAISQMSAAISHEVRNPLTAVQGFLQLLKDSSYHEEKRKELLEIALSEARRAEKIIQDYLSFSKPSIQNIERLNLSKELCDSINIVKPLASMNSIECIFSIEDFTYVLGDTHQFKQCIVNLLKNSIEAMPNGGVLEVVCKKEKNLARITISDSGIGMTKEQLHRLGEPYYSTKGSKGTGLGLMVSFGGFRAMKGSIHVESTVGEGTLFSITFPLCMKEYSIE